MPVTRPPSAAAWVATVPYLLYPNVPGIFGGCGDIQSGMWGCCCDSDDCIDPYKGRSPIRPLVCFAGVTIPSDNYTKGDDVTCDGKCVSVETTVQNKKVKVFQCVSKAVCQVNVSSFSYTEGTSDRSSN